MALLEHKDLMALIYKTVLMNHTKPSFLDFCDRDVDYDLFQTSRTQKAQLKKQMALLIQDALDYCVNQTEYEWKVLQAEWKKNPLYYYEEDDVNKQNGLKICVKELVEKAEVVEKVEEYSQENWFNGENIQQNKIEWVASYDSRETDYKKQLYKGFPLSFYCILKQKIETLKQIIEEEKDLVLKENITLNLPSGKIPLIKGSSLLHAAVALNSVQMAEFLLKQNKVWAEKDVAENTVFLQSIKAKNQASLVIIRHKLFVK